MSPGTISDSWAALALRDLRVSLNEIDLVPDVAPRPSQTVEPLRASWNLGEGIQLSTAIQSLANALSQGNLGSSLSAATLLQQELQSLLPATTTAGLVTPVADVVPFVAAPVAPSNNSPVVLPDTQTLPAANPTTASAIPIPAAPEVSAAVASLSSFALDSPDAGLQAAAIPITVLPAAGADVVPYAAIPVELLSNSDIDLSDVGTGLASAFQAAYLVNVANSSQARTTATTKSKLDNETVAAVVNSARLNLFA